MNAAAEIRPLEAAHTRRWVPSAAFLRAGKTTFTDSHFKKIESVTWALHREHQRWSPGATVSCSLRAFGIEAVGTGYAALPWSAARCALAEAWERVWACRTLSSPHIPALAERTSSNGFAAGLTDDAACIAAGNELKERAILLAAWTSMKGWRRYNSVSLYGKAAAIALKSRGWTLTWYAVDGGAVGQILAGLAVHSDFGAYFDTKYANTSRVPGRDCESRLALSMLRAAMAAPRHIDQIGDLPWDGGPDDHARFYGQPSRLAAFDFLEDPPGGPVGDQLGDGNAVATTLLCPAGDLPAVAVAYNPSWTEFGWGKKMIQGKNPWPHPLA